MPDEKVVEGQTVADIRFKVEKEKEKIEERIAELNRRKAEGKVHMRTYTSVDGALENLMRLGALQSVGIHSSVAVSVDEAAAEGDLDGPAAPTEQEVGMLRRIVSKSFDAAQKLKRPLREGAKEERRAREERRAARKELCEAEGRLLLLSSIHESEIGRRPIYAPVAIKDGRMGQRRGSVGVPPPPPPGLAAPQMIRGDPTRRRDDPPPGGATEREAHAHRAPGRRGAMTVADHRPVAGDGRKVEQLVDLRWNLGLPSKEMAEPTCKLCYFCAGLDPPIRAQHTLMECPKRRRAGIREYTDESMDKIRNQLARRRKDAEKVLASIPHAVKKDSTREDDKRDLLALTAAAKMLDVADESLPPPPQPPEKPPPGERRRAWESYARRRKHDASLLVSAIAKASRHEPGNWAEVKSIALLSPHERLMAGPIDAAWINVVGRSFGFDVTPYGSDHHLLTTVLELCRAPLPPNWTVGHANLELLEDYDAVPSPSQALEEAGVTAKSKKKKANTAAISDDTAYHHVNVISGEMCKGHPFREAMMPRLKGVARRAGKNLRPKPTDGWLQMASADGELYFEDLRSGSRSPTFPFVPGLPACVLPPRALEESAKKLAHAGEHWVAELLRKHGNTTVGRIEVAKALQAELHTPCVAMRAAQLHHEPCPLEAVVLMGHYLGIDASLHPDLMWIVDCALTPQLPVGWVAVEQHSGLPYYAHSSCGLAQWEHPQTAFLTGIVKKLMSANEAGSRATSPLRKERVSKDDSDMSGPTYRR